MTYSMLQDVSSKVRPHRAAETKMPTQFVNLTPHNVEFQLGDERLKFAASGREARVDSAPQASSTIVVGNQIFPTKSAPVLTDVYIAAKAENGESTKEPFPAQQDQVIYIVSIMVLQHSSMTGRTDVVAPGTGPKDGAIRFPDFMPDGTPNPRKGQIDAATVWITPQAAE